MDEDSEKKQPMGDYEVGYGRPPIKHRWKAGESGNWKGRPKMSGDIAENFDKILNERVVVTLNGVPTRMTLAQALARQTLKDALAGNSSARREVIRQHEIYRERTKVELETVFEVELILEDDPPGQRARFINGVPVAPKNELDHRCTE